MEQHLDTQTLRVVQQDKLKELEGQQENLQKLRSELERINAKLNKHEKLSADDTKYLSSLGWLSALSVTIASLAVTLS
ncbi:MAG: hypothetical protein WBM09_10765 [Gallionella sp.]